MSVCLRVTVKKSLKQVTLNISEVRNQDNNFPALVSTFMVFGCLRVESKGKRLWEGEHLSWIQEEGEPWVRMNTGFYENLSKRTYHQLKVGQQYLQRA